jgi:hypothetical protein
MNETELALTLYLRERCLGDFTQAAARRNYFVRLFPRMETLIRRHGRKDPGHIACRVGLIAFIHFLPMSVSLSVGAETYGNPARVVRVYSAAENTITTQEEPARVAASAIKVDSIATELTRAKEKSARGIVLSTGPYLPATGAIPLRFSSARHWPAPLSNSQPLPAEDVAPTRTASDSASSASLTETPATSNIQVANSAPANSTPGTKKPADTPTKFSPEGTTLTADMVLGYLGNLPANEGRGGERFEPAIARPVIATASVATSP